MLHLTLKKTKIPNHGSSAAAKKKKKKKQSVENHFI